MSPLKVLARRAADWLGHETRLVRALRPAYLAWLEITHLGRGLPWEINGERFRIDPRFRGTLGHDYDPPVAAYLRERVKPGATCLNVGANVGVYALQLARWVGPSGRVVAFEPNPPSRRALERHVRLNGFSDRVEVVGVAVGAHGGRARFYAADTDGMSRLGSPNPLLGGRTTEAMVEVVTLDGFCATRALAPDWIVMDIEGFELAALEGARELLARGRPRPSLVIEMHPDSWALAGTSRAGAETLLRELQLRTLSLTGQADPFAEYGTVALTEG